MVSMRKRKHPSKQSSPLRCRRGQLQVCAVIVSSPLAVLWLVLTRTGTAARVKPEPVADTHASSPHVGQAEEVKHEQTGNELM